LVAKIFLERTTQAWIELLEKVDIPNMPLHDLETVFEDPHLQAINFFQWEDHPSEGRLRRVDVPTTWSDSQPIAGRPAPMLGQHSEEVLSELGYSAMEISDLIRQGVTQTAPKQNKG
jgi:crotonobetainyl-CoA:carnitine CoA-transferase CaiB-like acyl-CoA transferase